MNRKAFTLIELLVVIAIIAILAAILFPVFAQAKESAKKANCQSNAKQWALSNIMYETDADDGFPVWMATGSFDVDSTPKDYDLLNILNPYVKSEDLSKTPADPFSISTKEKDANFPNPFTKPEPSRTAQRLYNAGWLSDYGINYQYMAGLFPGTMVGHGPYETRPVSQNYIQAPAATIGFITGIFDRTASGTQLDGGQLPIDPPCIFNADGTPPGIVAYQYSGTYYYYGGWRPDLPNAWNVFGGVWPYYSQTATTGFMDGHVKSLKIGQVSAGCNVLPAWGGVITDKNAYLWDNF